jgi:hypothetical protein
VAEGDQSPASSAGQRGVENRGIPVRDRTIDPGQAAKLEAARLQALAPGTYRRPGGAPPERQDFEAYGQLANERHVWRFARPDGSTYDTSWTGLGTGTTARAWASQIGHRVVGEVISGPAAPPASQPEPALTPPPLIPAEQNRVDNDQRGTANKIAAPPRSPKKKVGLRTISPPVTPSITGAPRSARLLEPPQLEIFPPDPAVAGIYASPGLTRPQRQGLLAAQDPGFALWLQFTLQPTVSNFLINLGLKLNGDAQLTTVGIIFPGQQATDRGNAQENGSQRNAFRHAFGQAVITSNYGRRRAVEAGYAHEDNPTIDTSRRSFSLSPSPGNALFEADTVADLLNNEIGRRVAERLGPGASNLDLARAVLREFREGGLYVATFDVPGVVRLSRQPLTQQEFDQMMTLLKTLKDNGRRR